jgi:uncharacterized phage protein (TIGR02218 family)
MKVTNAAQLAILATGQFAKADLWQFDLVSPIVQTIRLTNWDTPITVGGNTYGNGMMLKRGSLTSKVGFDVNQMDLEIYPQFDTANPLTVGPYGVPEAMRRGYFDLAVVTYSKLFMQPAGNVSAGATLWYVGIVTQVDTSRAIVTLKISDPTAGLNVAMPKNVYQVGCLHRWGDGGCTLSKASFKSSGTVAGTGATVTTFAYTGLSQAAGYFSLGTIKFTSGANAGWTKTVKSYDGAGNIKLASPVPLPPANGDTFDIYPGDDKTQATCTSKFGASNLAHFRGYPNMPVTETAYDGGT